MISALSLARQGFECYLIERSQELGGNLRRTYFTLKGPDPQKELDRLIREVEDQPNIRVFTGRTIQQIDGFVGNFRTVLSSGNGKEGEIESAEHLSEGDFDAKEPHDLGPSH